MSISVSDELQLFAQEIQRFLSPNILRDFARDVGFVQRTSKYQAKDLVALCVWMSQNVATTSLTQLSSCLEASTEVLISPEGLNQRFNKAAVQFLQHLLAELLNQKLTSSMPISSPYTSIFKRIRILDPTAFQLPDPFSFVYPGAGGCSHTAGVKIQLEYDLLSGQFLHIHHCKKIKRERLECHLYGQLIAILLCSSTMFQMRQLLLMKKKRELSEYKAIYVIKDYFLLLFQAIQKDTQELSKILIRLFNLLQQNGRKSHRYEKKTVFDILGVVYNCTMSDNQAA
ncbi:IS4 family transposase [Bacillus mycoides]|uniref:IS4 family transposase n=1 Tax=Bacillus mycoides TaxID=1405 RepID=UPI001C00BAD3|nr:IS4 family transposase [Bacillus mycoides]QWG27002.1 IS4 family transposase [Bacillus mycoides]